MRLSRSRAFRSFAVKSGSGQARTLDNVPRHVRLAPDNGLKSDVAASRFGAKRRQSAVQQKDDLFDHLVGGYEHGVRHDQRGQRSTGIRANALDHGAKAIRALWREVFAQTHAFE